MSLGNGTFSIVAADVESGEVGCAVQSKYFAVGAVVPWARSGVGAVATQAAGVAAYGAQILDELARGSDPETAIARVLSDDPRRETRQLGVVTADGRSAAFTGRECNEWAGARTGAGFAVQGNILAGESVVDEMARAFESSGGALVDRLVGALEAGQAAGGDRRGQQSAAIVVERTGAGVSSREGIDRICQLHVEDHAEPIAELRRLVGLWTGATARRQAYALSERGDHAAAADRLAAALARGEEAGLVYDLACYESLAGRRDDAIGHLRRAIQLDPSLREFAAGDADFEPIRADVSRL